MEKSPSGLALQRTLKSVAWLAIVAVLVVTIVPIDLRPTTEFSPNAERFGVMAVVGALFAAAYPARLWIVIVGLGCAAAAFEPLQLLAHGRHPSIWDIAVKWAGGSFGATVGFTAISLLERFHRSGR